MFFFKKKAEGIKSDLVPTKCFLCISSGLYIKTGIKTDWLIMTADADLWRDLLVLQTMNWDTCSL